MRETLGAFFRGFSDRKVELAGIVVTCMVELTCQQTIDAVSV